MISNTINLHPVFQILGISQNTGGMVSAVYIFENPSGILIFLLNSILPKIAYGTPQL